MFKDHCKEDAAKVYLDLARVYEKVDPIMAVHHKNCAQAILRHDEVARLRAHRKIGERLEGLMRISQS